MRLLSEIISFFINNVSAIDFSFIHFCTGLFSQPISSLSGAFWLFAATKRPQCICHNCKIKTIVSINKTKNLYLSPLSLQFGDLWEINFLTMSGRITICQYCQVPWILPLSAVVALQMDSWVQQACVGEDAISACIKVKLQVTPNYWLQEARSSVRSGCVIFRKVDDD